MNRSSRSGERPVSRGRPLESVTKEKEEDLALFLELREHDKERNTLLLRNSSDDLGAPPGSKLGSSPLFKIVSTAPARKVGAADDFLNLDGDKNDYDWLLTPPGTPLFPSLDSETHRSPIRNIGTPKTRLTMLKSRVANPLDPSSKCTLTSKQHTSSSGLNSSTAVTRRPSSSGGPCSTASRPATPTRRPTLPATSKPSRPSTPTSRATVSSKAVVPPRSSTPTARSCTPTAMPSVPASSRPASRSSTPTRRPPTLSSVPASAGPPIRSSSVTKSGPATSKSLEKVTASKSSAPPRGTSPTVKSRPWKPSDMPGFSLNVPPNLRTSVPERPSSASRGRPGVPSSRLSSVESGSTVRPRRQSCSPSRGRAPNGSIHSGSSVPAVSRSHMNGGDNDSPVLIGSKMVERVVSVRRLVPPKQEVQRSANDNLKSSSSPDSGGFGRTLSRKSLDMALRHMDIRRSIPNKLRPLMTNIPASSMYSVRSGPTRNKAVTVSDSPLATSSNASSEPSVNNNAFFLDGSEIGDEDDATSEKGRRSSPGGSLAR